MTQQNIWLSNFKEVMSLINHDSVINIITSLGLLSDDELDKIQSFCTAACQQIEPRLKGQEYSNHPTIIMVCASIALYNFLLINSTTEDFSSFKAGDVTVTQNHQSRIENAVKFKNEALVSAAPYLTDIDFVFKAVEV